MSGLRFLIVPIADAMVVPAVMLIIGVRGGMIFRLAINWMNANGNLESVIVMGVVEMNKRVDLGKVKDLEN